MNQSLDKLDYIPFKPLAWCRKPWSQTVAARYWPQLPDKSPSASHCLTLPDDDRLVILENCPKRWQPGDRIVVLVHGLTGCAQSRYMVRLTRKLNKQGAMVYRMNLRGCGQGFGLARQPYHSGRSEDTRFVLQWLAQHYPTSPVSLIGFSLGGNIALKMAGEDGQNPSGNLDSLVAVSPPIDLAACARHVQQPENRFFDHYFTKQLLIDIKQRTSHFNENCVVGDDKFDSIEALDDCYTAPRAGFDNAQDYYSKCSSKPLINNIKVPTLMLSSMDDPIIPGHIFHDLNRKDHIDLVCTERGGHVGFLSKPTKDHGHRWMDGLIMRWLDHLSRGLL